MPPKKPPAFLAGRKARVCVERVGLSIMVDDVPPQEAGLVAKYLLVTFRALSKDFPELREYPDTVPGGPATDVPDEDGWYEERHRPIGFTPPHPKD